MIVVAGEKLKKKDKLTIDKSNNAVKLRVGCVYIGICPKNVNVGEVFEVIVK